MLQNSVSGKDMILGVLGNVSGLNGSLKATTFTLTPHQQFFSSGVPVKVSGLVMNCMHHSTEIEHKDEKAQVASIASQIK
jgi:hypothetical protein